VVLAGGSVIRLQERRWGTATSAIWNVTYRAEDSTFAPILNNRIQNVDQNAAWQRLDSCILPFKGFS